MAKTDWAPADKARLQEIRVVEAPSVLRVRGANARTRAVVLAYLSGMELHCDLAAEFGYKDGRPIARMLALPWSRRMIAAARLRAERELLASAVPAQVKLQRHASEMAQIVIESARITDQKPRDRAEIALKAIEFAGERPAEKKVALNIEAKLGDLSLEELEQLVLHGTVPPGLRHEIDVTPEADE